ncbi:uncharacterized protein TNCV_1241361 [Trichonephila clavipes]|uniref:Sushi domain-containing protein n=1 Tax=Trichonephila clavipes TaxID=2585209 RepID=A0A8X7BIR3_TRICX|nr:uncharacterized protein TNCV_1241361 [Trichonephila clavipes]
MKKMVSLISLDEGLVMKAASSFAYSVSMIPRKLRRHFRRHHFEPETPPTPRTPLVIHLARWIFFNYLFFYASASCQPPDSPEGGSYTPEQTRYLPGDKVAYSCKDRLTRIGKEIRICQMTGKWSGSTPFCGDVLRSLGPRSSRMEEIGGLGIPLRSLWPPLHCRRGQEVSATDKGCRVYPLDPRPDAVALYSGCTPGKRRAWFCQMTGTLPPLLGSVVGGGTPERSRVRVIMDPTLLCPGKGLVLPNQNIDDIAKHSRFLIFSLPSDEMSKKSPFAIQKALTGIGGDPKSVRKLRSGDLLTETASAVQSKSFLMAKTFLDSTLTVTPHKSLNSTRGVISESDLLCVLETEILEGLSDHGVTQVRRITIKKDSTHLPTKHIILTFNSPKFPATIKAGYLNSKIRPYIPNPLRCFQCQRFGHSQTSCRGQLKCSRCMSAGHSSTDCTLEPKCINCLQSHASDSKLCPKWKLEKQIQEIKTNKNIPYF